MVELGRLVGQNPLGFVQLGVLQRSQAADLVHGQEGEVGQEPFHVGVVGVDPELEVIVGRSPVGVQPDRSGGGLTHLGPGGGGYQGEGQAVELLPAQAAVEVDPGGDVAPLIVAAHLQPAAVVLGQVVGSRRPGEAYS